MPNCLALSLLSFNLQTPIYLTLPMKKIFFTLLLLASGLSTVMAQVPVDATSKKVIYTEVVNVPNSTKDVLYDRAMFTLKNIYKEVEKKISTNDKMNGHVELNCSTRVVIEDPKTKAMVPSGFVKYKLKLEFKDGKYRYQFYDFHIDKGGYKYGIEHYVEMDHTVKPEDHAEDVLKQVNDDITGIITQLKAGLASDKQEKKSDW
jgi:hypothetical protein